MPPEQVVGVGGLTVRPEVKIGFTVIVVVGLFAETQPDEIPCTVYVVVAVGLACTVAPEFVFSPVEGDHAYVSAPVAVNVVVPPMQIVAEVGLTLIVGTGFILTVTSLDIVE